MGEHFYYAKLTQTDGKILWSAPIWVKQVLDTEAPVVTASVSGTKGQIKLNASASDNVGVKRVEFSVDGAFKGASSAAPYQLMLDSSLLANGNHALSAVAFDAANNAGSSGNVAFTVANAADVSALVRVSSSGLVFNRATQRYTGSITLTALQALSGPLQLRLDGLAAGVTLLNASGSHAGAPYITATNANLAAGASLTLPLSFSNPNKVGLSYSAKTYAGSF
ncbi:MAG: hypothetical protein IV107_14260 [Paucibacter sp.]|nr:hypothetical protein [Roseateles sp.]